MALCELIVKLAVETYKAREEHRWKVFLLLDGTAPVPAARKPPVDAATSVIKVVCPAAIKCVPEEVRNHGLSKIVDTTECLVNV
jgi:hypothetical protein